MNLYLFSNSTNYGEPYLQFCKPFINDCFAECNVKNVIFIPFAAASFPYSEYVEMVRKGIDNSAVKIKGIHEFEDKKEVIKNADCIITGGGNTFHLINEMYKFDLLDVVREKVKNGTPYIGWSAGSNLAGKSVKTTNDMPIIYPPSFDALGLVDFHINPHYTELTIEGHNGESRMQRLKEFIYVNPTERVVCLPEGIGIKINGDKAELVGKNEPIKILTSSGVEETKKINL